MIVVISAERIRDDQADLWRWICWLELTKDSEALWLPATAPGNLQENDLQAYFDAQEDHLWTVAQQKQYQPDVTLHLRERELLKRLVRVMMSEINILREVAGLPPRTLEQLKRALKEAR